jgi:hypothetical protein
MVLTPIEGLGQCIINTVVEYRVIQHFSSHQCYKHTQSQSSFQPSSHARQLRHLTRKQKLFESLVQTTNTRNHPPLINPIAFPEQRLVHRIVILLARPGPRLRPRLRVLVQRLRLKVIRFARRLPHKTSPAVGEAARAPGHALDMVRSLDDVTQQILVLHRHRAALIARRPFHEVSRFDLRWGDANAQDIVFGCAVEVEVAELLIGRGVPLENVQLVLVRGIVGFDDEPAREGLFDPGFYMDVICFNR